jgi:hypothetical protein
MALRPIWFFVLVCLAAIGSVACKGSKSGGAPQASKSGTSAAEPPPPGGEVARPTATELPGFAVGQWSKYRVTADEGQTFEITYKIVGDEEGAYWLEIVRGTAEAGTVMQLLISIKNRSDPNSLEIRAAKIRMPGGHLREIRGKMLEPTAEGYKAALSDIFVPALAGAPQEDVTVPAGTFRGTYKRQQKVATAQTNSESTVWIHPAVPISGLVKSEENGKPNRTELLTWGTTGAKSEIVREKEKKE